MSLDPSIKSQIEARAERLLARLDDHPGTAKTREEALDLVFEHTQSPSLRGHMLAVEASMAAYARKMNEDVLTYRLTGLLHDFDYEQNPEPLTHPLVGCELLVARGFPAEIVEAILGHATYTGVSRTTLVAKTLFAVDELTGFLSAMAYVRPGGLEGLSFKSFKKKFKTARFAAGVDRDEVRQGAAELGVELSEHVLFLARALSEAFPAFPDIPEATSGSAVQEAHDES